ncbi:UDP-N-acetylmuramyl tripeptide synthase [Tumebacillus sp. BK434]|uniref:MurT ligase domain-containing protein n=1 Tax=Tumebacillus sp. BK434 TaxID=2512169 RepID=UPI0010E4B303|nr:MurT ligase domain-containing protein [Tumebacillus sp. BK434]TCP52790.1 UDP-N-acetylmuramyl tripeptide synthase [Tumebacillus sp. BK434]
MYGLRFQAAVLAAKMTKKLLTLTGRKGTTLPGQIALRICPDLLAVYGKLLGQRTVFITGTNGKTTTSNLLVHFLRQDGRNVISNSLGANLIQGIATTLIEGVNFARHQDQAVVLEVDEATIGNVIGHLQPKAVVVTNFFRDQMDRYGELDTVVDMVGRALKKAPNNTTVILNADDPLVTSIAPEGKTVVYYGIESSQFDSESHSEVRDGKFCRQCGGNLQYSLYHYGQLGFYDCPDCDFTRPIPSVVAEDVALHAEGIRFQVGSVTGFINSPALYNVYNALAAITASTVFGVQDEVLVREMGYMKTQLGRMERLTSAGGRNLMLTLVKNPTGFNEVLKVVEHEQRPVELVIILNDRYADGTDVSWIWDTNIERLHQFADLRRIYCAGTRAEDFAIRLRYADLGSITEIVEPDIACVEQALRDLPDGHMLYILSTYTSLYNIRDHLLNQGGKELAPENRASVS